MKKLNQKGLAHLGLILLLACVVAIAGLSYKVVKDRNNNMSDSSVTSTKSSAQVIPQIKNTADLNTVETTLDKQNIDGNLNPDSFNDDTQSLL